MSILIIVVAVFIVFISYILLAPYTVKAECAVRRSKFNLRVNLSSFFNVFRLTFILQENRVNLEFIICRQSISLNRLIKKKKKKEKVKPAEKTPKSVRNIRKLTEKDQLNIIKKSFSVVTNCKLNLLFGSEDPYITGIVCAWVLPVIVHSDCIDFKPEFQERSFILIGDVIFSIYIYRILILFISAMLRTRFKDFKSNYHK